MNSLLFEETPYESAPLALATIEALLFTHFGLRAKQIEHASRGHTNHSYFFTTANDAFLARCSWSEKTLVALAREAHLLDALHRTAPALPVPRVLSSVHHTSEARCETEQGQRFLRVFHRLPGAPLPPTELPSPAQARTAMNALRALHAALRSIETSHEAPTAFLREKCQRIASRPQHLLPEGLHQTLETFFEQATQTLDALEQLLPSFNSQLLHCDFHLGNLLFEGNSLSGIVDFDDTSHGSSSLEEALTTFALARTGASEERFTLDFYCWNDTAQHCSPSAKRLLQEHTALLQRTFCLQQCLIHLEARQRSLWNLSKGIGFWNCWNSFLSPQGPR